VLLRSAGEEVSRIAYLPSAVGPRILGIDLCTASMEEIIVILAKLL
jgi:hypothetical protein